jgi:hypothetical protein
MLPGLPCATTASGGHWMPQHQYQYHEYHDDEFEYDFRPDILFGEIEKEGHSTGQR